jgi:ketosteroid isomerase-like protein
MTSRTRLAFVPAAVLAAVLLLHSGTAAADEVRDAVEAGNRAFIEAALVGDAKAVSELYTGTAQVIAPGAPVVTGRPAIAAFWLSSFQTAPIKAMQLETTDLESTGDLAYETGKVTIVARDGTTSSARYLVVWKREGGSWKLHRDIWNAER